MQFAKLSPGCWHIRCEENSGPLLPLQPRLLLRSLPCKTSTSAFYCLVSKRRQSQQMHLSPQAEDAVAVVWYSDQAYCTYGPEI